MDADAELLRIRLKKNDDDDKLSIFLFPWLAHGHITPFLELAKRLSKKKFHVYFCSTSVNLDAIKSNLQPSSFSIQLVELHLPSSTELPPHLHTTKGLPPHLMPNLFQAFSMAAQDFRSLLQSVSPDLVVYDCLQPWAPETASSLGIPAINFTTTGASTMAQMLHSLENPGLPPFVKFEDSSLYRGEGDLKEEGRKNLEGFSKILNDSRDVILVNSFRELEGKSIDYLSLLSNKKVIPVGPLVQNDDVQADAHDHPNIIAWLDRKQPNSTVFVSFGSEYFPSNEEMEEISHGLELSSVNFIWVIRFPKDGSRKHDVQAAAIEAETCNYCNLPNGFLEKVGERGMVVRDWAPQIKILKHSNVGGFLSHCGWNSVMESIVFGVPIIGMPMHLDQPFNAWLVEEMGVGVKIRRDCEGKIERNEVAKMIREVMVEKSRDHVHDVRKKVKEMSQILKMKEEEKFDDLVDAISSICKKGSI